LAQGPVGGMAAGPLAVPTRPTRPVFSPPAPGQHARQARFRRYIAPLDIAQIAEQPVQLSPGPPAGSPAAVVAYSVSPAGPCRQQPPSTRSATRAALRISRAVGRLEARNNAARGLDHRASQDRAGYRRSRGREVLRDLTCNRPTTAPLCVSPLACVQRAMARSKTTPAMQAMSPPASLSRQTSPDEPTAPASSPVAVPATSPLFSPVAMVSPVALGHTAPVLATPKAPTVAALAAVVAVPVTPCFAQPSVVASAVAVPSAHVPLALWTLPQGLIVSQWKCRAGPVVAPHANPRTFCVPSPCGARAHPVRARHFD